MSGLVYGGIVLKNKLVRALAGDNMIRAFAIDSTEMVERAREIHDTTPVSTAALGRTITAASIMGYMLKGDKDKLTFQIKGSNTIKSIVAVSDATGNVKAYISHPYTETTLNDKGKLNVGGTVGRNGRMVIIKDLGLKEPYVGQANLVTGEIAEDLAAYYMYSEQQPSIVALGVHLDEDAKVDSAGGFIIQTLPSVDEEVLVKLEKAVVGLPSVTQMLRDGMNPEEMLRFVLKDFDVSIVDETEVEFMCDCSKDKIERALITIGKKELEDMKNEDKKAEIKCHFCNTNYMFSEEDLQNIIDNI